MTVILKSLKAVNPQRKAKEMIESDKQRNNREANLKPFKPGQSGNPNGRPKKEACYTSCLKEIADQVPELLPDGRDNKDKRTWAWIIAQKTILDAAKGDTAARKEYAERVDGKVKEVVEQTVKDVTPIKDMTPEERKNRIIDILKATNRATSDN